MGYFTAVRVSASSTSRIHPSKRSRSAPPLRIRGRSHQLCDRGHGPALEVLSVQPATRPAASPGSSSSYTQMTVQPASPIFRSVSRSRAAVGSYQEVQDGVPQKLLHGTPGATGGPTLSRADLKKMLCRLCEQSR